MTRPQLEHVLRASAGITGADRFIVIGSQAILGQHPDAPEELLGSIEVDVFTLRSEQDANLIEGSIGEGSPFHEAFGYFAHGVAESTATLPDGWKSRLVRVDTPLTGGAVGLCLEAHDIAASKLVAAREKDLDYLRAMLKHGIVDVDVLRTRLGATPISDDERAGCLARLARLAGEAAR